MFIFCESDPNKEPRVIRTIEALSEKFEITMCGYNSYDGLKFFDMGTFLDKKTTITFHFKYPVLFRKLISAVLNLIYYRKTENILKPSLDIKKSAVEIGKLDPNLMICHGLGFLQLCNLLKINDRKLVLNAHEYYPAEFEHLDSWKEVGTRYNLVLSKYSKKIDLVFAVNQSIGERYKKEYGIPFVEVVNAPDYEEFIMPSEVNNPVKIVHHGSALANRGIEVMIEAVLKSTLSCELHLILVPTEKEYYEGLLRRYGSEKKIRFSDPVSVKQIAKHINRYDLGIYLLPPLNYNNLYALPNKFFEFVQGRLAIIVSPNPEMKKIVENYNLGWVTSDFSPESLIHAINSVSVDKISKCKNNSQKHAKELSSIKTKQLMLESVDRLCAA